MAAISFPTFTAETLRPADRPTLYFIGVTTGSSSIQRVFPAWARQLGLDAVLQGIDLPLHAPADHYRRVVEFIRDDPASMGALVTTHKIDLYQATEDLFDHRDSFAELMGETSCLSKRDGELVCHAKDPISSGLALDALIPPGHWSGRPDATAVAMGAGGSTIAISWHLTQRSRGAERPSRFVVTNRSPARLESLRRVHAQLDTDVPFEYVLCETPDLNDAVVAAQPPGSLIVNATGLGKDAPGSPVTDAVLFPEDALAWDLNYRGDLIFLDQARSAADRGVVATDGWVYFLHGWTQVIGEVFHIDIPTSGPAFDDLSRAAKEAR
jgi:shikimate 5-dehydrogenase